MKKQCERKNFNGERTTKKRKKKEIAGIINRLNGNRLSEREDLNIKNQFKRMS